MTKQNKKSIKYPENLEVRAQLKYGEAVTIAAKTQHDLFYVHQVLGGMRNSKKIIDCAKELIENRKAFLA